MKLALGLLILSLIIGHWSLNIAAVFLVLEMPVFGIFLAQRAIVCSHGRKPVERIGPMTPEPPQGAAEQFEDDDEDEDERK